VQAGVDVHPLCFRRGDEPGQGSKQARRRGPAQRLAEVHLGHLGQRFAACAFMRLGREGHGAKAQIGPELGHEAFARQRLGRRRVLPALHEKAAPQRQRLWREACAVQRLGAVELGFA
jgi:hypothetical protein